MESRAGSAGVLFPLSNLKHPWNNPSHNAPPFLHGTSGVSTSQLHYLDRCMFGTETARMGNIEWCFGGTRFTWTGIQSQCPRLFESDHQRFDIHFLYCSVDWKTPAVVLVEKARMGNNIGWYSGGTRFMDSNPRIPISSLVVRVRNTQITNANDSSSNNSFSVVSLAVGSCSRKFVMARWNPQVDRCSRQVLRGTWSRLGSYISFVSLKNASHLLRYYHSIVQYFNRFHVTRQLTNHRAIGPFLIVRPMHTRVAPNLWAMGERHPSNPQGPQQTAKSTNHSYSLKQTTTNKASTQIHQQSQSTNVCDHCLSRERLWV